MTVTDPKWISDASIAHWLHILKTEKPVACSLVEETYKEKGWQKLQAEGLPNLPKPYGQQTALNVKLSPEE